eukprot:TRINITY_DN7293_c0_g1_i1.p1 TRINITY_DN7293_c0_g1~~TRINITY_DN7293_c0_g1_i1.p1  ORF type:complete len:420 (-),score=131.71 TRINITY_DN7293_c0_g1_i1:73-1266(-)
MTKKKGTDAHSPTRRGKPAKVAAATHPQKADAAESRPASAVAATAPGSTLMGIAALEREVCAFREDRDTTRRRAQRQFLVDMFAEHWCTTDTSRTTDMWADQRLCTRELAGVPQRTLRFRLSEWLRGEHTMWDDQIEGAMTSWLRDEGLPFCPDDTKIYAAAHLTKELPQPMTTRDWFQVDAPQASVLQIPAAGESCPAPAGAAPRSPDSDSSSLSSPNLKLSDEARAELERSMSALQRKLEEERARAARAAAELAAAQQALDVAGEERAALEYKLRHEHRARLRLEKDYTQSAVVLARAQQQLQREAKEKHELQESIEQQRFNVSGRAVGGAAPEARRPEPRHLHHQPKPIPLHTKTPTTLPERGKLPAALQSDHVKLPAVKLTLHSSVSIAGGLS